ncbi:extracellular solute-binding protein [Zhihengliuella halotolerans]|uniref:Carbohydrate ABC transporter substrate-binding protein (CUT1 family) n=1 Tax=Zhihengliuella halotolerans TaxID=370736 RepID=A0A4Q8AGH7_9MICC|nr:extracellular solute-binding protein [Zhihengliuella halotolerans]RZU63472.1 carbohydrate ABC transporter substrate-binding protein (CUT1 family) [Zhihengliuella halotolerans]
MNTGEQTTASARRIFRRRILASAALVAPLVLSACGGGQPGGAAQPGTPGAWYLTGGSEPVFDASFEAWNEAHPDRAFATESFANDAFKEKIRTAVGSGQAPTLIYSWTGGTLADYVANGDVVDLTGKVPALESRALESVLSSGMVDGTLYAVPNNNPQPVILFTNEKLFEQVGVEPPTTWEETLDVVEKFEAEGVIPFSLAAQSRWPLLMWIQYLTDRIGGPEVFDAIAANEPDAWSDPAITEALEKIQELVDAGAFGDSYGSVVADNNADVALVHTDKAAMLLQGAWVYPSFATDAPDWFGEGNLGYTAFPDVGGSGDPANIVGNPANFWSISSHASDEEQQAAIEYLDEFNLNEQATRDLVDNGMVPATTGAEDLLADADESEYLTYAYNMVQDAPNFQLSWDQALAADQAQELLTQLEGIFQATTTPQQFVDAMNATIK